MSLPSEHGSGKELDCCCDAVSRDDRYTIATPMLARLRGLERINRRSLVTGPARVFDSLDQGFHFAGRDRWRGRPAKYARRIRSIVALGLYTRPFSRARPSAIASSSMSPKRSSGSRIVTARLSAAVRFSVGIILERSQQQESPPPCNYESMIANRRSAPINALKRACAAL